jgi:hypothetical protein
VNHTASIYRRSGKNSPHASNRKEGKAMDGQEIKIFRPSVTKKSAWQDFAIIRIMAILDF